MAKAKKAAAEGETPEAEGEGKAAPKKGFLSKKLIIMAAAGLLVLGGGGGWFFLFSKKDHHEEKPAPVAAKPPAFVDMPEVVVNLASTNNGRAQYLKAKIVLEVVDQKAFQSGQCLVAPAGFVAGHLLPPLPSVRSSAAICSSGST